VDEGEIEMEDNVIEMVGETDGLAESVDGEADKEHDIVTLCEAVEKEHDRVGDPLIVVVREQVQVVKDRDEEGLFVLDNVPVAEVVDDCVGVAVNEDGLHDLEVETLGEGGLCEADDDVDSDTLDCVNELVIVPVGLSECEYDRVSENERVLIEDKDIV
jgi:hypothetical protein